MTLLDAGAIGAGALAGAVAAASLVPVVIQLAPERLYRVNVTGRRVPATLGAPLVGGGIVGLLVGAATWWGTGLGGSGGVLAATGLLLVAMGAAGAWDDLRGDEAPRGFRGHASAFRGGAVTGGVVKLGAGLVAGLGAGALVAPDVASAVEVGALSALVANLLNLVDRAPGRAAKVALLLGIPLIAAAPVAWSVAAAGTLGALCVCAVPDLRGRAMLGDAGANPLGAVVGLGLGLALARPARLAAIALVLALNVVSERWSFSAVIERTRVLAAVDRLGRRDDPDRSRRK